MVHVSYDVDYSTNKSDHGCGNVPGIVERAVSSSRQAGNQSSLLIQINYWREAGEE
jgi:hypothetical protein